MRRFGEWYPFNNENIFALPPGSLSHNSLIKAGLIVDYTNVNSMTLVNLGLLIIRVVIGLTFVGHGSQKLFGWFGGYGPVGFGQWLESLGMGFHGKFWSIAAGLFEFVGGLLFAFGTLTGVGAGLIIIVMLDAILIVHRTKGYWIDNGGWEYNFVLIAVVLGIALIGPGSYVLLKL